MNQTREQIEQTRINFRQKKAFFLSGKSHFMANILFAFLVTMLSFLLIKSFVVSMILILPLAFLAGTLVEYWGHRSLLHVYRKVFKTPYQ